MSLTDREAAERVARVDALLDSVDSLPDPGLTVEALQALLDLYGEALARILAIGGDALGPALAEDELVAYLLLLHGLHPLDVSVRVERAVSRVRPRLGGSAVESVTVADGEARVRLRRGRGGCGAATAPSALLEEAIRNAAPELDRVEIDELGPPPVLITLDALRRPDAWAS
ncbi:NifU family protein [Nonomuraea sp. NPDC049269]|uniref:NifU family protein n=1 Tax=Nonomuraea sp. NPDC049269 TaxID=3364349 RepID=UPI0037163FE9